MKRCVMQKKKRMSSVTILPHAFGGHTVSADPRDGVDVPHVVTEIRKPIGGIGMTLRWSYRAAPHDDHDPVDIIFSHIDDPSAFSTRALRLPASIASLADDVEEDDEMGWCACVRVCDASRLMGVVVFLSRTTTFKYELDDPSGTRECTFDIGVERYDRASWNFWNQTDDTAAPKQSWHKWDFSWATWDVLPFTWRRLAVNIRETVLTRLPMPLRFHVARYRADLAATSAEQTDDEALRTLRRMRERHYRARVPRKAVVTRSLKTEQSRELIRATFERRFGRDDVEAAARSADVLRRYIMVGYTSRLFGPYRQEANHVGHGRKPRVFRHLTQYRPEALPVRVLNQIYQSDGTFRGNLGRRRRRDDPNEDDETRAARRLAKRKSRPPRQMQNDVLYAERLRAPPIDDGFFLALRGRAMTCETTSPEGMTTPATMCVDGS